MRERWHKPLPAGKPASMVFQPDRRGQLMYPDFAVE
jgi:hypothetical protein